MPIRYQATSHLMYNRVYYSTTCEKVKGNVSPHRSSALQAHFEIGVPLHMVVLNTLATTFGRSFPVRRQCLIAYAIGVEVFKANYSDKLTMTSRWRPNLAFAI